jgi:hypothetical protein
MRSHKRKPSGVYMVPVVGGDPVIVLARHPKGAAMVAHLAGYAVGLTRDIREVEESRRWSAINLGKAGM